LQQSNVVKLRVLADYKDEVYRPTKQSTYYNFIAGWTVGLTLLYLEGIS